MNGYPGGVLAEGARSLGDDDDYDAWGGGYKCVFANGKSFWDSVPSQDE